MGRRVGVSVAGMRRLPLRDAASQVAARAMFTSLLSRMAREVESGGPRS